MTIDAAEDAPTTVSLSYQIESAAPGAVAQRVRLEFREVLAFRFGSFDLAHEVSNPEDSALDLIEIEQSGWLNRLLTEGPNRWRPVGERLGGVLAEDAPQHYRITFDDHGSYDILCLGLEVTPFGGGVGG